MSVSLIFVNKDMTTAVKADILSFSFRKDAYLPYTKLSVSFVTNGEDIDEYAEMKLFIGEKLIHHGYIETLERRKSGGKYTMFAVSNGFTAQLCRAQIEPGLKMSVSLNSLMDGFYTLPYVEHENNSDTSNYIYVRKNTAMWDAVASLSYKLCGTYPYVRGANTVRITAFPEPVSYVYSEGECTETGIGSDHRRLNTNYHMADINGEYGHYDLTDSDAAAYRLVRHIYMELDMRFLYSPQQALEYRDKLDNRGMRKRYCVYSDYRGEDISDIMTIGSDQPARIMFIEIKGSSKGIFTKVGTYEDKFQGS